jgi:tRNA A-37 threonylcarbamoyl transferase component Bud32
MIEVATNPDIHWQVVSDLRECLLGPRGLRLDEWLQEDRARIVKHGRHRTVYHVMLPERNFYVKHYPIYDTRSWLRQLVRPSKALHEFHNAVEVARRGIATFVPLAVGEHRTWLGPAESYLVTQTLENTEALDDFLESTWVTLPADRRQRLASRLGRVLGQFVARMHEAGIRHSDLHAGNLLLRLDAEDRPTLFLIDLHAVSFGPPLDWPASRDSLIMINRWFSVLVSRSDRWRFWASYFAARELGSKVLFREGGRTSAAVRQRRKSLARDLELRTLQSNLVFWRRKDRRCLRNNRRFRRLRARNVIGHAVCDLDGRLLDALLADPDGPFQDPQMALLKNSRSTAVAELEVEMAGKTRRMIYKRFHVTAWSDPWAASLRPTPALRSWQAGHGLRQRFLPTPRPLIVLHRVRRGLLHEGYLLVEKIEPACDLRQFLNAPRVEEGRRGQLLRTAIVELARVIREMHRRRISHRDLKAANVLVQMDGDHRPRIWLIDLVGVSRHRRLPRRRRVQNLARLNASFLQDPKITRTDRLRFLRTYLQWGLRGRETWKKWWHAVDQATWAKAERNKKNRRPLA